MTFKNVFLKKQKHSARQNSITEGAVFLFFEKWLFKGHFLIFFTKEIRIFRPRP